ncbi:MULTISPECIES: CHAT domain-containing protein [Burkholderiaceae]|uniref:CHAT domain-containing protein n=1 Tax=Paraburkholderia TaxID=1822464 RepID=UPI001404F9A4
MSKSPDEYLGLPAGFLQAGAPARVSSLWAVDDGSTALLTSRFHKNHSRGR